jgi:hypothetical protein
MDLIFTVLFCLFGAASIVWGAYNLLSAYRATQWPRAVGTIVNSTIDEYRDSKGTLMYRPCVSYRYSVSGKEYTCDRRIFGGEMGTNWSGPAEKIVETYPAGANVTVHYNPGKPESAVLLPGRYLLPLGAIGFGALFVIVGLLAS